jgi:hypothetical protein
MRTRALRLAPCVIVVALAAGQAQGRVFMTQQQAIERAFPPPQAVERKTLYLSGEQARRAAEVAGVPVESRVIVYYAGARDGRATGYAYFDTHVVRTLPETVLILVAPGGRLSRIDILSFEEPEDYLPPGRWLQQFPGRDLDDDLALRRGIRSLTGASLSARAVTQAARRVLALHQLFVDPRPGPEEAGKGRER